MILYVEGDLFQSPAQVLVNTVNTVGVMGKGIALQFKKLFPEMYQQYRDICDASQLEVGKLWLYKSSYKWVLNFPTKKHWRQPSRIEYVEQGLQKFVNTYDKLGISSIAFPALGCGNGQLDFQTQVRPLMERYLRNLPIEVFIYPGNKSTFIEHLKPREMKQWLRQEPSALPFSEVWDDLTTLLEKTDSFKTVAQKSAFRAEISEEPLGIKIVGTSKNQILRYETLLSFWQQLRTHGFSARHIAPSLDRELSYLTAIFSELDYVAAVHIADDYRGFNRSATTGLQILPMAFSRNSNSTEQPLQLSLFS